MGISNDFKTYKKYAGTYEEWANTQSIKEQARKKYLETNPVDNTEFKNAESRGKAMINAINTMDEYSQSYAEDTEMATTSLEGVAIEAVMLPLMALFMFVASKLRTSSGKFAEKLSAFVSKHPKIAMFGPSAILAVLMGAALIPVITIATKAQIKASKIGRFKAMKEELNDPKYFAILNEEQRQKLQEEMDKIPDSDVDIKDEKKKESLAASIRNVKNILKENKTYNKEKADFTASISPDTNAEATQEELLEAKKNQQLLASLVRKIDIASQDYAENIELATNTITGIALGGGVLASTVTNFIVKKLKLKVKDTHMGILSAAIMLLPTLIISIASTKIQKDASRIGRFKVKQELAKDVNNFVYVDDEKLDTKDIKPEEKKSKNIFKFYAQALKDAKEYKEYKKQNAIEQKKFKTAIKEIDLTEEQKKNAIALQKGTFNTFDKVDDKSQSLAESVECRGEIIEQTLIPIISSAATIFVLPKLMQKGNVKNISNSMAIAMLSVIPAVIIDIFVTKQQKKASRVADMLALKELEEPKNYIYKG